MPFVRVRRITMAARGAVPFAGTALLLLWPALWNGYPLVFSDTGTYLSQAVERHLGWDRPVFYSFFLLSFHVTLTRWPAILMQGLLIAAKVPWPYTVTPVIHRDFPHAEAARYDAARQTRGALRVPAALQAAYDEATRFGALIMPGGLAGALRLRAPVAILGAAVLVCLLVNAAVTGALSGPHDRYQARVVWLAVFAPLAFVAALRRRDWPGARRGFTPLPGPVPVSGAATSTWSE
jgi:hypothetical protein